MKKIFIITSLIVISMTSCSDSDSDKPAPAQIIVTVTGECICNVFIYTPDGLCLQSRIWDCQQTNKLIFNLYHDGNLIIKAEYRDKSVSESVTTHFGHTIEIGLVF